jgi:hypothetical protein
VSNRLREIVRTPREVERILAVCGQEALLVGGQALAFWALRFGVEPVGVLATSVTTDADFIGTQAVANALQKELGPPWKVRVATLDDAGSQTAKVYAEVPGGGLKQVDFLTAIVGLDTDGVRRRAVEARTPNGATFHVLHPLDVLESRLRNLDSLPAKRNDVGVSQARLGIRIVRAFIETLLDEGEKPRIVLQAVRRVAKLALDPRLALVAFSFDLDVLSAVPAKRIEAPLFHQRQWPEVQRRLDRRRETHGRLLARRTALLKRGPSS